MSVQTLSSSQLAELEEEFAAPPAPPSLRARTAELEGLRAGVVAGDAAATDRQHAKGKLTARERIELLLDPGTFSELEPLRRHRATGFGLEDRRPHTDGVIGGWGTPMRSPPSWRRCAPITRCGNA